MKTPIIITTVREGWHAPGYQDPELHFETIGHEIHVRLRPQAFRELLRILSEQQATIDRTIGTPLDRDTH